MHGNERRFTTRRGSQRILFGRGSLAGLAKEVAALEGLGEGSIPVLATPRRRAEAEAVGAALGQRFGGALAIAREHVPEATVEEGLAEVRRIGAAALVAFGGGSAIGLAKAIAVALASVRPDLPIIAVPTTYSGSEMTPIYGITRGAEKRTARSERARPMLVVYDAALSADLPHAATMASLWNAIAHAAEVLWMPGVDRGAAATAAEALRLLATAARLLSARLDDPAARDLALEGAYLAGATFGDVGSGLHHKLCHILGGRFGMAHGPTHAAVLGRVAALLLPFAPGAGAAIAAALGARDALSGLAELAAITGIETSLVALGFPDTSEARQRVVADILASPPPSPRPLDEASLALLFAPIRGHVQATVAPTRTLRAPDSVPTQPGFGSTHDSEALPGALPRTQNAPRPPPYGLYPELLSGTPFTVRNAQNSRVWMYRVRASFSHGPFRPLPHPRYATPLLDVEPNRTRWQPLPIPPASERTDFVDGLCTLGGEGPVHGPGYVVNLYAANADMVDRAFSTADGDLLLVPQEGTLDVRTELGFLRVPPGSVCLVPRGMKFAVGLPDGAARGWMTEVYGPRFRLPERGPIGSNGLADARHFQAPTASYEDRLCPDGFEIVHKIGGSVFSATQEHSAFDVVAWHGVHVPYVYDLMLFNAMGSVTWDHVDPSIHTVLTAPLDADGRAIVDFVVFRGRWDVAEHSFRPPFMHRNAASEVNGVIRDAAVDAGYVPGSTFVSPLLTAHGITTKGYDAQLSMPDAKHEGPRRMSDASLWIMFESALSFRTTRWARETTLVDAGFAGLFEGMKSRFDPRSVTR